MNYETEYSNFPTSKIALHHFKNIDDTEITYTNSAGDSVTETAIELITRINTLRQSSNSSDKIEAANLINAVGDALIPYIVDAETFNRLEQEIYNTQIYAKTTFQSIHFGSEAPDCTENDVWIGEGVESD